VSCRYPRQREHLNESTATVESARAIARSENHDRPADGSHGEARYDEWRNVVHSDTIAAKRAVWCVFLNMAIGCAAVPGKREID